MCAVRSGEVVKPFPFVEFGLEIDVTFVAEKLIELLLIRSVRSFDFAVELRCAAFDVGVPDPEIFDMSMELGLELMTVVSSNLANAEWELFDDVIWSAPVEWSSLNVSAWSLWSIGTMLLGAGGRQPSALCGLTVL